MEKLLELLNDPELEPSSKIEHWTEVAVRNCEYLIISKGRGFIQKLVEKGHINEWKFFRMTEQIQDAWRKIDPPEFETTVKDLETYNKIRKKYLSERLIMFLSIQDDPIKVLIEIIE